MGSPASARRGRHVQRWDLDGQSPSAACLPGADKPGEAVSGVERAFLLKVVGAKVVTNARSPGARCYGFVTMSTSDEATKCISHLHRTELHGRMISVEKVRPRPLAEAHPRGLGPACPAARSLPLTSPVCSQAKNEPAGKKLSDRKECEVKKEKLPSVDRHHSVEIKVEK